jgi:hypothetical protein
MYTLHFVNRKEKNAPPVRAPAAAPMPILLVSCRNVSCPTTACPNSRARKSVYVSHRKEVTALIEEVAAQVP